MSEMLPDAATPITFPELLSTTSWIRDRVSVTAPVSARTPASGLPMPPTPPTSESVTLTRPPLLRTPAEGPCPPFTMPFTVDREKIEIARSEQSRRPCRDARPELRDARVGDGHRGSRLGTDDVAARAGPGAAVRAESGDRRTSDRDDTGGRGLRPDAVGVDIHAAKIGDRGVIQRDRATVAQHPDRALADRHVEQRHRTRTLLPEIRCVVATLRDREPAAVDGDIRRTISRHGTRAAIRQRDRRGQHDARNALIGKRRGDPPRRSPLSS